MAKPVPSLAFLTSCPTACTLPNTHAGKIQLAWSNISEQIRILDANAVSTPPDK